MNPNNFDDFLEYLFVTGQLDELEENDEDKDFHVSEEKEKPKINCRKR